MSPKAGFVLMNEIVPRLRSAIPRCVKPVGAEDAEELVQDGIVQAAKMLDRLERQGKQVTPGNIAYYTVYVNPYSGIKKSKCLRMAFPKSRSGKWAIASLQIRELTPCEENLDRPAFTWDAFNEPILLQGHHHLVD